MEGGRRNERMRMGVRRDEVSREERRCEVSRGGRDRGRGNKGRGVRVNRGRLEVRQGRAGTVTAHR